MKTEKRRFCRLVIMHVTSSGSYLIDNRDHYLGRHYRLDWPLKAMNSLVLRHLKWDWLTFGAKNCPRPPSKNFFFSGIEDFAALGAYIIDYIRVLVPNGVYLKSRLCCNGITYCRCGFPQCSAIHFGLNLAHCRIWSKILILHFVRLPEMGSAKSSAIHFGQI